MSRVDEMFLKEVAQIERAQKGKIYPAGCTLIALSAAKGDVEYLEEAGEVETRFAVVIPDSRIVLAKYLYISINQYFAEFLHKHRTGINLQFSELEYFKIGVHDMKTQKEIICSIENTNTLIEKEEQLVNRGRDMKKYMLDRMMIS